MKHETVNPFIKTYIGGCKAVLSGSYNTFQRTYFLITVTENQYQWLWVCSFCENSHDMHTYTKIVAKYWYRPQLQQFLKYLTVDLYFL